MFSEQEPVADAIGPGHVDAEAGDDIGKQVLHRKAEDHGGDSGGGQQAGELQFIPPFQNRSADHEYHEQCAELAEDDRDVDLATPGKPSIADEAVKQDREKQRSGENQDPADVIHPWLRGEEHAPGRPYAKRERE